MGIGAGAGIGVVRGLNASMLLFFRFCPPWTYHLCLEPLMAANWAVGTFVVVSVGMW